MAGRPVLLSDISSMDHDTGAHPERAARMVAIERELAAHDWSGYERVRSPEVNEDVLAAVHPRTPAVVSELAHGGGGRIDSDTVVSAGSWEAALHAAGGAVELVRRLVDGSVPTGFSAHRPPGHHAEADRPMGFCLFNNVAVAATYALDHLGLERVMIVDYDVHHGNGTNAIFHSDPRVLFVSIHQMPLYPGSGPLTDVGSGAGEGYSVNLPVSPGAGDREFRHRIDWIAVPLAHAFAPQLVLVSAGFDAGAADPLADCQVTVDGFASITASLRLAAQSLGVPIGAVLEGGYSLEAIGPCVRAAMEALAGAREAEPVASALDPGVTQARAFLARWWPTLAVPAQVR